MVPTEPPPSEERETLQLGPRRASLVDRLPPAARRRAGLILAGGVGIACGVVATTWWDDLQRDDRRTRSEVPGAGTSIAAAPEVRLVMTGVRPSRPSGGRGGALVVDAALLHDRGPGTATVTQVGRPGRALRIRARALPVTLSVNRSFVPIRLRIAPRDCALATQWTPSSQPFTVTWTDGDGEVHVDLGGDHDAGWEIATTGLLDDACGDP